MMVSGAVGLDSARGLPCSCCATGGDGFVVSGSGPVGGRGPFADVVGVATDVGDIATGAREARPRLGEGSR